MSTHMDTPAVEAATQAFLDAVAAADAPPIYELSPAEARAVMRTLTAPTRTPLAAVDIERHVVGDVPVRVVRPHGATGTLPVVVYCHGAGWVLGGFDTHERLVRELAVRSGAALVFPEYDLAPEARYPTQNEQSFAVLRWVADRGHELGLDPTRLAVAGDSVGGNMATVLTLMARRSGGPAVAAQLLFYPVTDAGFDTPSYERFAEGHFLTREAMRWFWDAYLPDDDRRSEPTASPLRAPTEELALLPPAMVVTGELDVLRDEGEAYADRLAAAGVAVTTLRYRGTIHDFVLLDALAETPAARGAVAQGACFLRDALAS